MAVLPYTGPAFTQYQGSFQDTTDLALPIYYFDVKRDSYGGTTEADATIRVIPWSGSSPSGTTVVIQGNSIKPREFNVVALFYSQAAYDLMLKAVCHNGLLMTPRLSYPGQGQTPRAAWLQSVGWGRVDHTTPSFDGTVDAGAIEAPLKFIITDQ